MSTTTTPTTTATGSEIPEFAPITVESLPKVQSFPVDADISDIIKAMKMTGGCIIKNAVAQAVLAQIEADIRPHLDSEITWDEDFFPKETKRIEAMIAKSRLAAEEVVNHAVYQRVCAEFLTSRNWYWSGSKKVETVSEPQLNNSIAFSIAPGAWAQPLHRDSWCHHAYESEVLVYPDHYGRDVGVGWFVAGKPATRLNGATRFIPGSHLWSKDRPPQEELTVQAELQPGDAFMMLSSCYHAGSANKTIDEERLLFSCFMTKGFLRQEENQYLALPHDIVKKMPVHIQQLIGYKLSQPYCGWVDNDDPRVVLDPSLKNATIHYKDKSDN